MLLPPEEAQDTIAYLEARPEEQRAWVCRMLGTHALAPYSVPHALFPGATRIIYNAVGGVGLAHANPALRAEVLANLRAADAVGVRDRVTQGVLAAAGITAQLMPDPAVIVAELFEAPIRARAHTGELAQLLQALPQGYLAVQFSAEWRDDATLAQMAAQLDLVAQSTGLGVVLFRAGAAPWHDELANLQGVAVRMQTAAVRVFTSLHLWDICALIAHSRGYCGSSLHGRIVAMAFALPRLSLCHPSPPGQTAKTVAFATTWEPAGLPVAIDVATLADGMQLALATPRRQLEQASLTLPTQYRQHFGALCALPA